MRVNALLVANKDGHGEKTDATAITADGRIEAYRNYRDDTNAESLRKATSQIDLYKTPRWQRRIGIEPTGTGDLPFVDFGIADTITTPDQDLTPSLVEVIGLLVSEDDAGNPIYQPEVGEQIPSMDQRNSNVTKAMNAGTGAGRDLSAMPRGAGRAQGAKLAGAGGGPGYPILVAAYNAPEFVIAAARFVCDGTDDQTQVAAAITLSNGGMVRLSSGSFFFDSGGVTLGTGSLIGEGMNATTISVPDSTAGVSTAGGLVEGIGFDDLDTGAGMVGVACTGATSTVSKCMFSTGDRGVTLTGNTHKVLDCHFDGLTVWGVDDTSTRSIIEGSSFTDCGSGVTTDGSVGSVRLAGMSTHITDCTVFDSTDTAVFFDGTLEAQMTGCHLINSTDSLVRMVGATDVLIGSTMLAGSGSFDVDSTTSIVLVSASMWSDSLTDGVTIAGDQCSFISNHIEGLLAFEFTSAAGYGVFAHNFLTGGASNFTDNSATTQVGVNFSNTGAW